MGIFTKDSPEIAKAKEQQKIEEIRTRTELKKARIDRERAKTERYRATTRVREKKAGASATVTFSDRLPPAEYTQRSAKGRGRCKR